MILVDWMKTAHDWTAVCDISEIEVKRVLNAAFRVRRTDQV